VLNLKRLETDRVRRIVDVDNVLPFGYVLSEIPVRFKHVTTYRCVGRLGPDYYTPRAIRSFRYDYLVGIAIIVIQRAPKPNLNALYIRRKATSFWLWKTKIRTGITHHYICIYTIKRFLRLIQIVYKNETSN